MVAQNNSMTDLMHSSGVSGDHYSILTYIKKEIFEKKSVITSPKRIIFLNEVDIFHGSSTLSQVLKAVVGPRANVASSFSI